MSVFTITAVPIPEATASTPTDAGARVAAIQSPGGSYIDINTLGSPASLEVALTAPDVEPTALHIRIDARNVGTELYSNFFAFVLKDAVGTYYAIYETDIYPTYDLASYEFDLTITGSDPDLSGDWTLEIRLFTDIDSYLVIDLLEVSIPGITPGSQSAGASHFLQLCGM